MKNLSKSMNYTFARLSRVSLSNVCDVSFLQRNITTSFLKKIFWKHLEKRGILIFLRLWNLVWNVTYFVVQLRPDDCMVKKYIPLNKPLQVIVLLHIKCFSLMQVLETSKVLSLWILYSGDNNSYQVLYDCPGKINVNHENLSILTNFSLVSHFYTPWKLQKTFGFLTFSWCI